MRGNIPSPTLKQEVTQHTPTTNEEEHETLKLIRRQNKAKI